MRAIKHAFLSLIRKPTKAVMILVILFVVYSLVFTGIIIQNSVKSSKEYVRKELGAVVEMKADYMKAMNDQLSSQEQMQLGLSASLANEIAKDPLVKGLYITQMAPAASEKLQSAVNLGNTGDSNAGLSVVTSVPLDGQAATFMLLGSNQEIPLEFSNGTYEITQGRLRSKEDEGKDTLIISEELASKNNLSVGDMVDLTSSVDKQTYSFEIIGIFKGSSSFSVDQMYTSLDSAKKMAAVSGNDNSDSISFLLYDPMEVDTFIKQHENQMPNDYIVLYANDNEYKSLTKPLDLVSTIITILIYVVFIAGVIIMLAIISIFVRDRKFEIGLLLSSGEGKLKILSQFLFEILLVSIIAFGAAAATSKFSADYTASWIVKNQLVEEDTQSLGGIMTIGIAGPADKKDVKMSDIAKEFNVSVDQEVIRDLLLISLGLVVISAGAPLLIILSYKPRESLQD